MPDPADCESAQEIVRRLAGVISRELPMAAARELLDENLCAYMDGKLIARGRAAWFRWVRFLHRHADKTMSGLALEIERMECAGDTVSVFARWRGEVGGETKHSETGAVQYQIRGGKIIAVRTHKKNYVFIYGKNVATAPGFYWLLLRIWMQNPR
ncbi:MAG: nuclear transport factor 2 family protein [Gammaproteobacteria bacterium]